MICQSTAGCGENEDVVVPLNVCTMLYKDVARGRKEYGSTVSPSAECWELHTPWELPAEGTVWRRMSQATLGFNKMLSQALENVMQDYFFPMLQETTWLPNKVRAM